MISKEYRVTGMCCGECEMTVLDEVAQVKGVEVAEVSASTGRLVITSTVPVDTLSVLDAVEQAGCTAMLTS
jgi:copper chaperone CopZ